MKSGNKFGHVWKACRFSSGDFVGVDATGGFVRVEGLENAYLGVDGELETAGEALRAGDGWEIVDVREQKGGSRTPAHRANAGA